MADSSTTTACATVAAWKKPLRLLDLPQEVQDNIYHQLFDVYHLVVVPDHKAKANVLSYDPRLSAIVFKFVPNAASALRKVSRKVARDSWEIMKQYYSGVIKLGVKEMLATDALKKLTFSSNFAWVVPQTTAIEVGYSLEWLIA